MLPVNSVVEIDSYCAQIHDQDDEQVDTHTKVSESKIAHQELGDRH